MIFSTKLEEGLEGQSLDWGEGEGKGKQISLIIRTRANHLVLNGFTINHPML